MPSTVGASLRKQGVNSPTQQSGSLRIRSVSSRAASPSLATVSGNREGRKGLAPHSSGISVHSVNADADAAGCIEHSIPHLLASALVCIGSCVRKHSPHVIGQRCFEQTRPLVLRLAGSLHLSNCVVVAHNARVQVATRTALSSANHLGLTTNKPQRTLPMRCARAQHLGQDGLRFGGLCQTGCRETWQR